jgi:hypothetical protein
MQLPKPPPPPPPRQNSPVQDPGYAVVSSEDTYHMSANGEKLEPFKVRRPRKIGPVAKL